MTRLNGAATDSERERRQRYYCSREWGLLKEAVRERCGDVCERCRAAPMYALHHLTYIRLYHEQLEDLQGLCEACHEYVHGKQDQDPTRIWRPPTIGGIEIDSVYLAGRISANAGGWRAEILPGWGMSGKEAEGRVYDLDTPSAAEPRESDRVVPLPDGRSICYAGPFWMDVWGGHGGGFGPHAMAGDVADDFGNCELTNPKEVARFCLRCMLRADLVFAWLDSRDCYGTLFELGRAGANQACITVVAVPKWDRELWFACAATNRFIVAESAGAAWEKLWRHPDMTQSLGAARDHEGPSEGDL